MRARISRGRHRDAKTLTQDQGIAASRHACVIALGATLLSLEPHILLALRGYRMTLNSAILMGANVVIFGAWVIRQYHRKARRTCQHQDLKQMKYQSAVPSSQLPLAAPCAPALAPAPVCCLLGAAGNALILPLASPAAVACPFAKDLTPFEVLCD